MTKKNLLLDCTMRTVAENGLMDMSMQKITEMAGTSEALIYKHYKTKELLLLQCYLQNYEDLKKYLRLETVAPQIKTKEEAFHFLHALWVKYFHFLISNDYKTLFIYEYRNSVYMRNATAKQKINPKEFFSELVKLFYSLDDKFGILQKIDLKSFFIYVTDVSLIFAVRVINARIPNDEKTAENVWKLIWNGEKGLLDHNEN